MILHKWKHRLLPGSISSKITFAYIWLFAVLLILLAVTTYFISSTILINKSIVNMEQNLRLASEKLDMIMSEAETFAQMAITDAKVQEIISKPKPNNYLAYYNDQIGMQNALFGFTEKTLIDSVIVYDELGGVYSSGVERDISDTSALYKKKFSMAGVGSEWLDTTLSNYKREDGYRNVISFYQKFYSSKTGLPIGSSNCRLMKKA